MTQTIIVPIRNLQIYRDIEIGNVKFIRSAANVDPDSSYYDKLQEMIIIMEEDKNLPEPFLNAKKAFTECVLAEYTSDDNDNKAAREDAQKNIERSLNVLRFYLSRTMGRIDPISHIRESVDPIFHNMFMAMEGLAYSGLTVALGVRPDGSSHTQYARTGYIGPYEITEEIMKKIEERHLDKLDKILRKREERRRTFEKNILTSIDFYGSGMNEYSYRNRFVNFIISLETLLLVEKEGREALGKRAAIILEPDSDARQRVQEGINELYDIRNEFVHEGKDKVTLNDIRSISETAFEIILKLINYSCKFNDKHELRDEVNNPKYNTQSFEFF